tara:strand:- start:879 stop:1253 length:375 start_codon:yes stop_codon:yes gene_type:complete
VVVLAVPVTLVVDLADPDKVVRVVRVADLHNQVNLGNQDLGDLVDSRASADQSNPDKVANQDLDDQSNLDKVANQDLDDLKVLAIRIRVNDPGNLKVTAHNKVAPDPSSLSLASCNAIRTMMAN